jgi:hypothetical protein
MKDLCFVKNVSYEKGTVKNILKGKDWDNLYEL